MTAFAYDLAFSRNIGWVTEAEQARLRGSRVAIAGMGGVGGFHLLTLARLGVGQFNIADLDTFELANFNRQAGAGMASIDRAKVEVLAEQARQINPELDLRVFP
jgi:tRNA A37 threonylcarbamoyladenosine dehydratase